MAAVGDFASVTNRCRPIAFRPFGNARLLSPFFERSVGHGRMPNSKRHLTKVPFGTWIGPALGKSAHRPTSSSLDYCQPGAD